MIRRQDILDEGCGCFIIVVLLIVGAFTLEAIKLVVNGPQPPETKQGAKP